MNDPGLSFGKRKLSLQLNDSAPLSSSSFTNRNSPSFTADALKLRLLLPRLNDTFENIISLETIAEPSLDENEVRKSPMSEKEVKQNERREHQLPDDQANSGTKSSISDKQSSSLPGLGTGNHDDSEDAGNPRNNVILDTTDNPSLTSTTQPLTGSDAPIILAHDVLQIAKARKVVLGKSNAAEADNRDTEVGLEEQ